MEFLIGFLSILLFLLIFKPIRKAISLCTIIVGVIFTLTGLGAIVGIPIILIGGVFIFI